MAGECVFRFGKVELIFKLAKDVVADSAVIAEVDGGLALHAREFANEIDAAGEDGGPMRGGAVLLGALETLLVKPGQLFIERGEILMVEGAFLLQVLDRCFEHEGAGFGLFTIGSFGAGEAEGADQRRKRESLKDKRYENYGKGEEENQVSVGKGPAVGQREGQRKSSGEGHDTAHAGPAHYENLLVAGHAHVLMKDAVADEIGDVCAGIHPEQAKNDQDGAKGQAVFDEFDEAEIMNFRENVRELQADGDENETVENESKGIPESPGLNANRGAEEFGTFAAEVESAGDNGKDAGRLQGFREKICRVGNDDADGDFDRTVFDEPLEPFDHQSDEQADKKAGNDEVGKAQKAAVPGSGTPADQRGDGKFESHEAAGVVDEAFTFKNVDDALGQSEALGDGGGRDGVGGGNNRAEDGAEAPVKALKNVGSEQRNSRDGEAHKPEGQHEDADHVETELAPGSLPRRGVQQGRQDHQKNHVGIELNARGSGNEAEHKSGDDENDGIRSLKFPGENGEEDDEKEQREKDQLDDVNGVRLHGIPAFRTFRRYRTFVFLRWRGAGN